MANKKGPDETSPWYDMMLPKWQLVETLLNGTDTMRAAGTKYLPQHEGESRGAYNERLFKTTLLNLTKLTLESWVGRPFREPLKDDELPDDQRSWFQNVDLQGNNLDIWARDVFREGLAKGMTHVLVDFPRLANPTEGVRTLADDNAQGSRPYFVHVKPENLFYAHAEVVDGVEKLMQIRLKEHVMVEDGFEQVSITRIKVLTPGRVVTYDQNPKTEEWFKVQEYEYDLDFIPLVTFYSDRMDFMMAQAPLMDLAHLNVAHWQSQSDQTAILTTTRFPMLAGSGVDAEEDKIVVGPNNMLTTNDPQGRFYYVEHGGKAIEAGRKDLESLEDRMKGYGAEFLKKRPGRETATARSLDSSESMSGLQAVTIAFQAVVNHLYILAATWTGGEAGTVEINTQFGSDETDSRALDSLRDLRLNRDISRVGLIAELVRYNILSDEFDAEADAVLLEAEIEDLLGQIPLNPDPAAPDPEKRNGPEE
jgi:hypothetical protein